MPAEVTSNVAAIATSFFNVSKPEGGIIATVAMCNVFFKVGFLLIFLRFAILQFCSPMNSQYPIA